MTVHFCYNHGMNISTKDHVLALLMRAGGNFISGEEAGKSMNLSRAAVSTAIRGLRDEGYDIESVTNRGYRLSTIPDALCTGTLLSCLTPKRMETVICLPATSSTNSYLMEMAQKNAPDGQTVLAEMQTDGRGRKGGHFDSPKAQGIYLSYLIKPDTSRGESALVSDWQSITKRVGTAVYSVIKDLTGIAPAFRGNELFINDRKFCGILTQTDMEVESGMIRTLVVGIGIRVHQTRSDFGAGGAMTSLDIETGRHNSRPVLASKLILSLDELRSSFFD